MRLSKKDFVIIIVFLIIFLLITIPGIDWGAPGIWNPDEIIKKVAFSYNENPPFDQNDLTYPDLPLFIMTFIANLIANLGKGNFAIIVGIRAFSVFLGSIILISTYFVAAKLTSNRWVGITASLLIITNNEYVINSRFAHNDIYLMFFSILSVYSLFGFQHTKKNVWLYISFAFVGFAAASKYNGGALILAPILIYLVHVFSLRKKKTLKFLSELFLGGIISFLSYIIGNPSLLKNPLDYFNKLIDVLTLHATYNILPGDKVGFWGQFSVLYEDTFGKIIFIFVVSSFLFVTARLLLYKQKIWLWGEKKFDALLVILVSIFVYDLPIMVSYNYPSRFFLFFIPLIALMVGVFLDEIAKVLKPKRWIYSTIILLLIGGLIFSALETISVFLTFKNDSRIVASEYIFNQYPNVQELAIEYTLYPPRIDKSRFLKAHNYPLILIKFPDQEIPTSQYFVYNTGEEGIEIRRPDIIVVDSLTYDRFENNYVCELHLADCLFFEDLLAGHTNYKLVKSFIYELPSFLPEKSVTFTNPDIHIFQRMP